MGESPAVAAPAPDSAAIADAAASWRAAYVHLPFCRRRCPYCDFAVVTPGDGNGDGPDAYVAALVAEIGMEAAWGPLDAVNFGGGTPSLTPPDHLERILAALDARFGFTDGVEVSLEANPEDWSDVLARRLLDLGFTRVSFGVQSFDVGVLGSLGRLHGPEEAEAVVSSAMGTGFPSVGLDLIFGTPAETMTSWEATVQRALALAPDHLSAYALTVEPGTALSRAVGAGAPSPDPDDQADKYEHLEAAAAEAGLVRYEVSNYARPGHPCRYNLVTWAHGEYVAFGLGAHDHRDGSRGRNLRRLDRYLEAVAAGVRPRRGTESLDGWSREQERLMVGLRRTAGVRPGKVGTALLASDAGRRLLDAGVVAVDAGRLRVVTPLLTDAVVRTVLSLAPGEC